MRTLMLQLAAEADGCSLSTVDELVLTAEDLRITGLALEARNRGRRPGGTAPAAHLHATPG